MMEETIEHMGVEIQIRSDDDPTNPREDSCYLGKMVCWNRRHRLGDEQPKCSPHEYLVGLMQDMHPNVPDDISQEHLDRFLDKHYVILPLYLYDHSGITMSTGRFSCPWDSGQVGFIYVSLKDAADNWRVSMDWDSPVDYHDGKQPETLRKRAIALLEGEVEVYDQYLTGDVWGYVVADGEDDEESCWGFFGQEHCIEEAKRVAEYVAKKRADAEAHLATCSYEI
jgi:hypothetical protein